MELAPAPVNLSDGVLVLQSPPRRPPGVDGEADDEQEPWGVALVDVELEDLQATARRPAAQAIVPKRSRRRRRCIRSSLAAWVKGLLLGRAGPRGPRGNERSLHGQQYPRGTLHY